MVLGTVAAATNFMGQVANGNSWVADAVGSHLLIGSRQNKAEQTFTKQLQSIEFKLTLQKLHREDIRDLVELTFSRMNIYNLVGMLLLDFCVAWYTDNKILEENLPIWFNDLFLISNYSAVGYLIVSVWLTMYAGIASRSIGVRMLTSFARLSIPNQTDLQQVKVPIFFRIEDFWKRKIMGRSGAATTPGLDTLTNGTKDEDLNVDDQQHFRKFLQELPRWLGYDIQARVCMSYGINQMLQALAYYILGVIWLASPMTAITSFVAVRMLSLIMLWLDVSDDHDRRETIYILTLHFGPTILAALLLFASLHPWVAENSHKANSHVRHALSLLATLCFWGHALMLWHLHSHLYRVSDGKKKGKFKAGEFANVLEWVQFHAASKDLIEKVEDAVKALQHEMVCVLQAETTAGVVSAHSRQSEQLERLCENVVEACKTLESSGRHPAIEAELLHGDQALKHFEVFAKAPKILGALEGARHKQVQALLTQTDRRSLDTTYQVFLDLCRRHNIGICAQEPGDDLAAGHALTVLNHMLQEEMPVISLVKPNARGEGVWVDTRSDEVSTTVHPDSGRTASLQEFANVVFPRWQTEAEGVSRVSHELLQIQVIEDGPRASTPEGSTPGVQPNGGATPGVWAKGVPDSDVAPFQDSLPKRIVGLFTKGTVLWWLFAGCAHAIFVAADEEGALQKLADEERLFEKGNLEPSLLQVKWPEPAALFTVDALHCSDSHLWISSKFLSYETIKPRLSLLGNGQKHNQTMSLREVWEGPVGTLLCGSDGCDRLIPSADGGPWQLTSLREDGRAKNDLKQQVFLPRSWRRVAASRADCGARRNARCNRAWIAGWDGTALFTATMSHSKSLNSWTIHDRLELDPSIGYCQNRTKACHPPKYNDVNALQLSPDGQCLIVLLSGGIIDVWDLSRGAIHGRLRLNSSFSSMCADGNNLFLAGHGDGGPVLASAELPLLFAEVMSKKGTYAQGGVREVPESDTATRPSTVHSANPILIQNERVKNSKSRGQQRFLGTSLFQRYCSITGSETLDLSDPRTASKTTAFGLDSTNELVEL